MLEGLFQPMHLLVILVIALIVFGPGRLPELGAGLGKSIREFKKALSAETDKPAIEDKPTEIKKEAQPQQEQEQEKKTV